MARHLDFTAGAGVGENVADLADRDDSAAGLRETIEKRGRWRQHRIILAIGGAGEIAGSGADEGAGDDAADVQFIGQLAGNPADVIEMLEAEAFFVGGNLDDTVGACIDNRLAAAMCSAPSSSMISVPEACLFPRMPGSLACLINSSVNDFGKAGMMLGK